MQKDLFKCEAMILFDQKFQKPILGLDEAGRGPLCGPVVSCCVWWKEYVYDLGIQDSKKLSAKKRAAIFDQLLILRAKGAIEWGIGIASAYEIDEINILQATKLSMVRALKRCAKPHDYQILVDGNQSIPGVENLPVIQGDQLSFSIATASIIAKVFRDHIMEKIHCLYPQYGLAQHKGYGTKWHKEKLRECGLSPYHRQTFRY